MGVLLGLGNAQLGLAVRGQILAAACCSASTGGYATSQLGMVASYSAMQT